MSRFQGIGKAYYGKSKSSSVDNSYITTEWFVLLLLPIVPLKCLRVIKLGKVEKNYIVAWSQTVGYKIIQEIPKKDNLAQVLRTLLFAYGGIALFIGSFFLTQISDWFAIIPFLLFCALLFWGLVRGE